MAHQFMHPVEYQRKRLRVVLETTEIMRSNVFLNGEELEIVQNFKYLGVIPDPTLSFKNHVKKSHKHNSIQFE